MTEKTLLWNIFPNHISVLVPKKRGTGYLRQPYGHHIDRGLEEVRNQIDYIDIFGLDGALEIMITINEYDEKQKAKAREIMDVLSKHYGYPHREVKRNEFWERHPLA